MSAVEICQGSVSVELLKSSITPDVGTDIWNPAQVDHNRYFDSEKPDERLTALGINIGVVAGMFILSCNPERLSPKMAGRVSKCLGFLSTADCYIAPWALPILRELGIENAKVQVPTPDVFAKSQWEYMQFLADTPSFNW